MAAYDPNTSHRSDYRLWPGARPVTLSRTSNTGHREQVEACKALRRPIGFKELVPSGGAYVSRDVVFLIPDALVSRFRPRLRDQIVDHQDKEYTTYTILEANLNVYASVWRCIARNLVLEYDLTGSLKVLRPSHDQDVTGHRDPEFTAVYEDIPCRVQEISSTVGEAWDMASHTRDYTLFVGEKLELSAQDVLEVDGVKYDLVGTANWDRIDLLGEVRVRRIEG